MRTNEERIRLIHKRTAELNRKKEQKKRRVLDVACMAACLLLVVGIGSFMPGLSAVKYTMFPARQALWEATLHWGISSWGCSHFCLAYA